MFFAINKSSVESRKQLKIAVTGQVIIAFGFLIFTLNILNIWSIFSPMGYIVSVGLIFLLYDIVKYKFMNIAF